MYIKHVFGQEGYQYIRTELARYSEYNSLRKMLSDLPIESGSVFAFLPAIPPKDLIDRIGEDVLRHSLSHYYGGVYAIDPEYTAYEIAFIRDWLENNPRHIATFQERHSGFEPRNAPFRTAPGERVFLCSKPDNAHIERAYEPWVFIDRSQSSHEEIRLAIARGTQPYPPVVGLLTSLPEGMDKIELLQILKPNEYSKLVENTMYIVVEAFDLEVMLFWENPSK